MIEKLFPYYGIIKYVGIIVVIASSYLFVYNKGYNSSEQKNKAFYSSEVIRIKDEQLKEYTKLSDKYYSVSTEYQEYLKTNKDTIKVIHDTKIKEIEKPVYSECIIPITGVQVLNESTKRLNQDRQTKNSP